MSIHVTLTRNALLKDGSLHPRVFQRERIETDELLDFMIKDTAIEKADMLAMMKQFSDSVYHFLSQGRKLVLPFGTFSLGMRRSRSARENGTDQVDHTGLHVIFHPSREFMEKLRGRTKIVLEDQLPLQVPAIGKIVNMEDTTRIDAAASGQMIALRGSRFRFSRADTDCGVFFVGTNGATGAKYRSVLYTRVGTSCIDCKVPELPDGLYQVQVRTRPTGKEIRIGSYPGVFVVGTAPVPAGG